MTSTAETLGGVILRRWRSVFVGVACGAGLLLAALWGVPLRAVGRTLAEADPAWLAVTAGVFLVQQAIRAWRQALLLRAAAPRHRFRTSLSVLCVSFLLINTLPLRLGEVARPLLLLEREEIPMGQGFAMVFVERALDLMSMFVMIASVAWLVPVPARTLTVQGLEVDWVQLGRVAAGTAVPLVLAGLVGLLLIGPRVLGFLEAWREGRSERVQRVLRPVLRFGSTFVEGTTVLRNPQRLGPVLALTAVTWVLSGWMYPALARALGIGSYVGFGEGIGVLSITMLGMAVPAAPGFAGTYEAFVRGALALFGVVGTGPGGRSLDAVAVAFALTMHWWVYLVQASTAVFFLVADRIDLRRLLQRLAVEVRGGA